MSPWLNKIDGDLYDVSSELKRIDGGYELYFNKLSDRYEIYNEGVLQIAVPFKELDARTIAHVLRTRVENAERLIRQIEEENALAERKKERRLIEKNLAAAERAFGGGKEI